MSVRSEKIAKNCTFELREKKTNKDIENFCPGAQGPCEMHSQKNFRALRAVGSPKQREHTRARVKNLLLLNTD